MLPVSCGLNPFRKYLQFQLVGQQDDQLQLGIGTATARFHSGGGPRCSSVTKRESINCWAERFTLTVTSCAGFSFFQDCSCLHASRISPCPTGTASLCPFGKSGQTVVKRIALGYVLLPVISCVTSRWTMTSLTTSPFSSRMVPRLTPGTAVLRASQAASSTMKRSSG